MRTFKKDVKSGVSPLRHAALVVLGAVAITLSYFMILPLMQTIGKPPEKTDLITHGDIAVNEPPPPPPMEEPEEKPDEPPPPDLADEAPPLDLSQLELALNPGMGGDWGGDFAVKLNTGLAGGENMDAIFSLSDLDQAPRAIYQPAPQYPAALRSKKLKGTVTIIFVVDKRGRVQSPKVQKSTNPGFNQNALKAVRQWKFEPAKKGGKAVSFRYRVPLTFLPAS